MDAQQVKVARQAKQIYLLSILFNVIAGVAIRVTHGHPLFAVGTIAVMVFGCVATWRFCQAIGIGKAWSAINTALCPFTFLLQLIVLLRMYSKRTGIWLSFLGGDKAASRA